MPSDVDVIPTRPMFIYDQTKNTVYFTANAPVANVKDDGARGDGSIDDTVAIQHTIDNAAAGATIYFPPGTYLVSKALHLKNNQTYMGDGCNYASATIKQADNANAVALMAATEYLTNETYSGPPIRVVNLSFEGNSANNSNGGHGVVFMSSNCIIEECWFRNISQAAIVFSDRNRAGTVINNSSIENHIMNCKVEGAGQYGIWIRDQVDGRCTDGYIRDCVISSTGDTAIFVERGAGWFLSGNHVYNCQQSGIIVNNAWSTSIIGNEVDGYGFSTTSSQAYFTGLGITCIGPRATIVEGNIIATPEINPTAVYQHLSINGGASTDACCIVTGNAILGGYVNTTSSTTINSAGKHTITVAGITNISTGQSLTIDVGGANEENVTILAFNQSLTAGGNTITADFSKIHKGTYYISSNIPPHNSVGMFIQSFTNQQKSGQPFYVQLALNRVEGVGYEYTSDFAATTKISAGRFLGDIKADGDLVFGRHLLSSGPMATVTVGVSNGSGAPAPTLIGNDIRGTISFGCGLKAQAGIQVNVKFSTPYVAPPFIVISPVNASTANVGNTWYVGNQSSSGFSIASTQVPSTQEQSVNTYSFNYQVLG